MSGHRMVVYFLREHKHSVRYDAEDAAPIAHHFSIYIPKSQLPPGDPPRSVAIIIEPDPKEEDAHA